MFILTLPFTGLEAISQHVSAAGLMSTLTLLLLLLMAIVREPQKRRYPIWRVTLSDQMLSDCRAYLYADCRLVTVGANTTVRLDA